MGTRPAIDLHLHSTFSDGLLGIETLIARCAGAGLRTVAVADHDTLDQTGSAIAAGERHGVTVLPAIELSTGTGDRSVHLLGYRFDPDDPGLRALVADQAHARLERIGAMAERLQRLDYRLDLPGLLSKGAGSVGRPGLAAAVLAEPANRGLLERAGIFTVAGFYRAFLVKGTPAYVRRRRVDLLEAIAIVHAASGLAVLAHPGLALRDDPAGLTELVGRMVETGLDGLEAFYPAHDRRTTAALFELAGRHRLIVTAGSDYHGPETPQAPDVWSWNDFGIEWRPDPRLGCSG